LYTGLTLDYRLRQRAFTTTSHAISVVAELLVICFLWCSKWILATSTIHSRAKSSCPDISMREIVDKWSTRLVCVFTSKDIYSINL